MKKITTNESLYVLTFLLAGLPISAMSEPEDNDPRRIASRLPAPPAMELEISSWLEQSREEAFEGFRREWQAEAKLVMNDLGNYTAEPTLDAELGPRLADEAAKNLALILANREEALALQAEVEALAAN